MAWTFILRRTTALGTAGEVQRISGAIPTVQRLGYALGAAYVGIVANAAGFVSMDTPDEAAQIARRVFGACVPFALFGVLSMTTLVREEPSDAAASREMTRADIGASAASASKVLQSRQKAT